MFTVMAAYGVSLFAASGDHGAYGDGGNTVEVNYPASDPLVTGVGGTRLTLNSFNGLLISETAWSPDGTTDESSGGDQPVRAACVADGAGGARRRGSAGARRGVR